MNDGLAQFEKFVRSAKNIGPSSTAGKDGTHPFDERNIHPEIAKVSLNLFDNGHYSQSTFEAFKLLDNTVKDLSSISESGFKLMMAAFNETAPKIELNKLITASDKDEQLGFRHIFAGVMAAIRNPRGHEIKTDTIDLCLDHLSVASVLFRTLENRAAP